MAKDKTPEGINPYERKTNTFKGKIVIPQGLINYRIWVPNSLPFNTSIRPENEAKKIQLWTSKGWTYKKLNNINSINTPENTKSAKKITETAENIPEVSKTQAEISKTEEIMPESVITNKPTIQMKDKTPKVKQPKPSQNTVKIVKNTTKKTVAQSIIDPTNVVPVFKEAKLLVIRALEADLAELKAEVDNRTKAIELIKGIIEPAI